jgi:hypothetical protein
MIKLNPNKISETLKLDFKTTYDMVSSNSRIKTKSYIFKLGEDEKQKVASMYFHEDESDNINITVIEKNNYRSNIVFSKITKIVYIPKYRAVRFESHTKSYFSILKVYWRGQFDLFVNLQQRNYKKTIWAKEKSV